MIKALSPILFVIAALIGFFYYIKPGYAVIQSMQREVRQYDIAIEKAEEFADLRDELVEKMNALPQTDVERLERMVPDAIDPTRLIIEMNEIAKKFSTGIENIKITSDDRQTRGAEDTSGRPYNSIAIGFQLKSSYLNFVRFVQELETSLRLTDISALSITTSQTEEGMYTFDVTIKTYWLKPQ